MELLESGNFLELSRWRDRNHALAIWAYRQWMIYSIIQVFVDIIVLITVICCRKRREAFIILTPLLMLIGNTCAAVGCYIMLAAEDDLENMPMYQKNTKIIFAVFNFTLMMSHQVFGAQYLGTSLILPKLFDHAKLEWLLHEPRRDLV